MSEVLTPTRKVRRATIESRYAARIEGWYAAASRVLWDSAGAPGCFRRSHRRVADGLDVVAVRVEDEGAVVVWMIKGTGSGRAVVLRAGSHSSLVERVDGGAIFRVERDM